MDTKIRLSLRSWNRFDSPGLRITPDVCGRSHTFIVERRQIEIELPAAPSEPLTEPSISGRIGLSSSRQVDGKWVPIQYSVASVDVTVLVPGAYDLPEIVLQRPPNLFEALSVEEQEELNSLAASHSAIARIAIDRWMRAVRWKIGSAMAGRGSMRRESGGTALIHSDTRKRIWLEPNVLASRWSPAITLDQWIDIGKVLERGGESPTFVDLLFDSVAHLDAGDLRRAVIDAAVSAETYIRSLIQEQLPADLGENLKDLINESHIRPVMTKVLPETLSRMGKPALPKAVQSELHQLLDARNKLVHTGNVAGLNVLKCSKYIDAVYELLHEHIPAKDPL